MLALSRSSTRVETTSIYHVDRMRTVSRVVSHGVHCVGLQDFSGKIGLHINNTITVFFMKTVCILLHICLYVGVHGNFKNIAGGEWFLLRSFLLTVGIHLARLYRDVHNIGHAVSDCDYR